MPPTPADTEGPWDDDPFQDTTPTGWSRIRRLGDLGQKKPEELTPGERERWRSDFERFVADYRDTIVAVMRVRHPGRGQADELADDFLAEVGAESKSLRAASPQKSSFRRYLQGWLRNYGPVRQRKDLTTEHRKHRAGDAHEQDPADTRLEDQEHRAWVRAIVRRVVERLHDAERKQKALEETCAFAVARYHGIPLPGDDPAQPHKLPLDELARLVGITLGSLKNRITRGLKLFRQYLEPLLRDTVDSTSDLRAESRWFFGVLDNEYPGLGNGGPDES
ncbi:MAG TPA: sigma-70 family RNA polymerase sigma factor [Planctomycetota bacterium]|nr:sigma-70 family RNA polymerase sigma factor [Planctomycetota bacterium]